MNTSLTNNDNTGGVNGYLVSWVNCTERATVLDARDESSEFAQGYYEGRA